MDREYKTPKVQYREKKKPKHEPYEEHDDYHMDQQLPSGAQKSSKGMRKNLEDCNLDDLFINGRRLSENDYKDFRSVLYRMKFHKCLKTITEYFQREAILKKSIVNAHCVIENLIQQKISPMLLKAYLVILNKNPKYVDDLSNYEEIEKLRKKIHPMDYPYFCETFNLKISSGELNHLIEEYARDGKFSAGFKLLSYADPHDLKKKADILVSAANRQELKIIAPMLVSLKFTKNDYPHIHDQLVTDSAFGFYHTEGADRIEQLFRGYPNVLAIIVGKMLSKKGRSFEDGVAICSRNHDVIRHLKYPERMYDELKKKKYQNLRPNQLQTNRFEPSDRKEFCCFSDFKLTKKNVFFVQENHPNTEGIIKSIVNEDSIGIDTESEVVRTCFDQEIDLVATLQIATKKGAYVFDPIKIGKKDFAVEHFRNFFMNPKKKVIGHTVHDDLNLILDSLHIRRQECRCEVIELKEPFKVLYPDERVNLANMTNVMIGKPLCKNYTLTDWRRRPLLDNQLHYAALDAYIVLQIYEKIIEQQKKVEKSVVLI